MRATIKHPSLLSSRTSLHEGVARESGPRCLFVWAVRLAGKLSSDHLQFTICNQPNGSPPLCPRQLERSRFERTPHSRVSGEYAGENSVYCYCFPRKMEMKILPNLGAQTQRNQISINKEL